MFFYVVISIVDHDGVFAMSVMRLKCRHSAPATDQAAQLNLMLKNEIKRVNPIRHAIVAVTFALAGLSLTACSKDSNQVTKTAGLTQAFGLSARALDKAIVLNWPRINDAKKYNLYWSYDPGVTNNPDKKIEGVTAPYTHTGLENGKTVYYAYTVETSIGEGAVSAEISLTPKVAALVLEEQLAAIGGDGRIELSWCCVPRATDYKVYWKASRGVTKGDTVITDATSPLVFTGLNNGEAYYFAVTALFADASESELSDEVVAIPYAAESLMVTLGTVPNPPQQVYAYAGHNQVTIDSEHQSDALRYTIYWSTSKDVTAATAQIISNVGLPYTHLGLEDGKPYFYRIAAKNQHGGSRLSVEISNIPNNDKITDLPVGDPILQTCISTSAESYGWKYQRQLEEVDCANSSEINLSGLERFSNLSYLRIAQATTVTNLSILEKLPNLLLLGLDTVGIVDLSFLSNLTNLTQFYLGNNSAADLSTLQNLSNLSALGLYGDGIDSVDFLSTLTNLTYLNLTSNQIDKIDALAGLVNLEELYLGNNSVTDLSTLENLPNLTALELYGDGIVDLSSLSKLTHLTYLDLTSNLIDKIDALAGLVNLEELYLGNNAFDYRELNASITNLKNLRYLNLSSNKIENLDAVGSLTQLVGLYIANAQLGSAHLGSISKLTNLQYLNLSSNSGIIDLSDLAGFTQLQELNLANNRIEVVAPLAGMTLLTSLDLQYNNIVKVSPLAKLINLVTLNLSFNKIGGLGVGQVDALTSLINATNIDLSWNGVVSIVNDISVLDPSMSCVELDVLLFSATPHLSSPPVDLDGNPLTTDVPTPGVNCT